MTVGARSRNFILVSDEGDCKRRRFLNGGTAVSAGDMLTLSSNTLSEVTGANTVGAFGVAAEDIAASEYGTCYCGGMFKGAAVSGVDFTIGDLVYNADKDTLGTGSATHIPVGRVTPYNDTDPASGGTVYFDLWSIQFVVPAAKS